METPFSFVDNSNGASANHIQQLQAGTWNNALQVVNRHSVTDVAAFIAL